MAVTACSWRTRTTSTSSPACCGAPSRTLGLAARLGAAAHARVLSEFVGDRHLEQYVDLFSRLVSVSRPD